MDSEIDDTGDGLATGPEMSEPEFWTLVGELGWGTDPDYKAIGRRLGTRLSPADLQACERTFDRLDTAMHARLQDYEKRGLGRFHLGDDGFADLCAHIVGLGREVYEATLAAPDLAILRARSGAFDESFAYVFQCAQADDQE